MYQYSNLINRFLKEVKRIEESLVPRQVLAAGEEKMIYGKFEEAFKFYSIESLREGRDVTEKDFLKKCLNELVNIEKEVVEIEKQEKLSIQFNGILSYIHQVKNKINIFLENINSNTKSKLVTKKSQVSKNKLAYKWEKNHSEINSFYKLLKKNGFIAKETKYLDFECVFKQKPITEIKLPVIWLLSATELLYLFLKLMESGFIPVKDKFDYNLLKACFINQKKEKFTENFKNFKSDIEFKITADKQGFIEKIISEISKK